MNNYTETRQFEDFFACVWSTADNSLWTVTSKSTLSFPAGLLTVSVYVSSSTSDSVNAAIRVADPLPRVSVLLVKENWVLVVRSPSDPLCHVIESMGKL